MTRPMTQADTISLPDVLFWLNDHIGEDVTVYICTDDGAGVSLKGKLHHWTHVHPEAINGRHEIIRGQYDVGGACVDLSGLAEPIEADVWADRLTVTLDTATTLDLFIGL